MIDTSRKGILLYCPECHKKMRFVSVGRIERDKRLKRNTGVFVIDKKGHSKTINRW